MTLYQLDTEKQADRLHYGYAYTWTNVYLVDAVDHADAEAKVRALAHREALVMPNAARVTWAKVRTPVGAPAPVEVFDVAESGHVGDYEPNMNLFQTARLVGYSGNRLVWYKRWRGPLLPGDYVGDLLTSAYSALLTDTLLTWLVEVLQVRTRSGKAITHYYVDPRVWGWQMRDGRRRRRKSVIGPP